MSVDCFLWFLIILTSDDQKKDENDKEESTDRTSIREPAENEEVLYETFPRFIIKMMVQVCRCQLAVKC